MRAPMQMNLEYLAIDTQVFPYGTRVGPIALSGCILIALPGDTSLCHGRSAGVVDCLRCPMALAHVALAFVEPADSRNVMPEVFRASGIYNRQ